MSETIFHAPVPIAEQQWSGPNTGAPRIPMTPAQLDAYRPSAQPSTVDEAKALAYKTGIKELEPIIRRLIALEEKVVEQQTKITALQTTMLALKYPKKVQ